MRSITRLLVAAATALAALVAAAGAAGAHGGVVPFVSEVTTVTSAHVSASVAQPNYLVVAAAEGHSVEIPGYDGEPYLRAGTSGGFEVNVNSPAYWLNKDTDAAGAMPEHASSRAQPEWEPASIERVVAIHHHGIHWMSSESPERDNDDPFKVQDWQVPIVVDGAEETIYGELWFDPAAMNPIGVRYANGAARPPTDGTGDGDGGVDMALAVGVALAILAAGGAVAAVMWTRRSGRD